LVEQRVDDFAVLAGDLDAGLRDARDNVTEHGTLISAVDIQVKSALELLGKVQSAVENTELEVGNARERIADHETRLGEAETVVNAQASSIAAMRAELDELKAWVAKSNRRWTRLWAWICLLPMHLRDCPATPYSSLLDASNFKDLGAVAAASAPELIAKMKEQNARAQQLDDDPDEADIDELIRSAKSMSTSAAGTVGTRRRGK
jgi:hypothetical protein